MAKNKTPQNTAQIETSEGAEDDMRLRTRPNGRGRLFENMLRALMYYYYIRTEVETHAQYRNIYPIKDAHPSILHRLI